MAKEFTYTCPHGRDHWETAQSEQEAWEAIVVHHASEHGWCQGDLVRQDFILTSDEITPKARAKEVAKAKTTAGTRI